MSIEKQLPPPGLPIRPPPIVETGSCRQCDKTFNPLWRRSHICGHCGYAYCSACISDGQALMPRASGSSINQGPLSALKEELGIGSSKPVGGGYEVETVCTHCLGMLQVTAAPVQTLRSLPIKRLKDYLAAYDISCVGPKEKEDFVQAVVKARNAGTGCLSPEAESFYRRKSVPKGTHTGASGVNGTSAGSSSRQARPSPSQNHTRPPPTNQYARPPPPHQYTQARPPPNMGYTQPPPNTTYQARQPPTNHSRPPQPRSFPQQARPPPRPTPAAQSAPTPPKPKTPEPPVPTILSLVSLPKSYLSSLSIGTLKAILYENHVRVDFKQVLEKEELVNRVDELIRDERKRLERQRLEEEKLAAEEKGETVTLKPPSPVSGEEGMEEGAEDKAAEKTKVPTGPMPEIDRGLCVVCQDEEATLAVVDCGHLAMCAHCSDLIMATSKECPLCRTRIVTPQRLIRIYRV